jgi:hypothetical protein
VLLLLPPLAVLVGRSNWKLAIWDIFTPLLIFFLFLELCRALLLPFLLVLLVTANDASTKVKDSSVLSSLPILLVIFKEEVELTLPPSLLLVNDVVVDSILE